MNSSPSQPSVADPAQNSDNNTAAEYTGRATYCPEDNKLRLYVGRVPRDEFLKLRAEGWTTLHKQREAGGGDFAATWTPERRDTAIAYAGIIEDEDMGPEERAADRAERFGGYRDKRTDEATGHADRYDNGPSAHGYQSQARAERAAARHDRVAGRAVDAWDKAEYWQRRTAGVISHALYKSEPHVRMGRIKELEADLRRHEKSGRSDDWTTHYRMRLAYENQMLEAQGGRAGEIEIEVGGWVVGFRTYHRKHGPRQIYKVNKSPATGRVVSVTVKLPGDRWGNTSEGWHFDNIEIERASPDCYRAPTDEERAAFLAQVKEEKAERKAKAPPAPPLINPTDADAERLVELWNEERRTAFERRHGSSAKYYKFEPCEVRRITQATYSAASKGAYARAETRNICAGHQLEPKATLGECLTVFGLRYGSALCQVRATGFDPVHVIILTDKPKKPLPAAVWQPNPDAVTVKSLRPFLPEIAKAIGANHMMSKDQRGLWLKAAAIGWAGGDHGCNACWTEAGIAELRAFEAKTETLNA